MTGSFRMPRNPADFRAPSVLGEDGQNMFAEPNAPPESAEAANPFCPPAAPDTEPAYQPRNFETTLPHRGGLVLTLGWLGLIVPLAVLAMLAIYAWLEGLDQAIPLTPLVILSLAFSLPAWIMSSVDKKALDAGAMEPAGRRKTILGGWLGVAGAFLALFLGLPAIVVAFYWIVLTLLQVA